jgi:sulfur carrier protein ThiS
MNVYLPDGTVTILDGNPVPVISLLKTMGINPIEVIITKNGRLVPEDAVVSGSDEVKVFRVAHGG